MATRATSSVPSNWDGIFLRHKWLQASMRVQSWLLLIQKRIDDLKSFLLSRETEKSKTIPIILPIISCANNQSALDRVAKPSVNHDATAKTFTIIMVFRRPNFSVRKPDTIAPTGSVIMSTEANHEIWSRLNAKWDLSLSRSCVVMAGWPRHMPEERTLKPARSDVAT